LVSIATTAIQTLTRHQLCCISTFINILVLPFRPQSQFSLLVFLFMTFGVFIDFSIITEIFIRCTGYIENANAQDAKNPRSEPIMNKLSAIIKGSVCLLGLVGVGNFFAAPASAEQAAARGAVTLVRASGASISVSGELTLPQNAYFTTSVTVEPVFAGTSAADDETITSLVVTPGGIDVASLAGSSNVFVQAAADALIAAAGDVGATAAIIRAGAGVNGLGGLE
jgi:hypothetical protein